MRGDTPLGPYSPSSRACASGCRGHVPGNFPVGMHETLKLVPAVALPLQYGVEGLNVGVEVRRLNRCTLVHHPQAGAGALKPPGSMNCGPLSVLSLGIVIPLANPRALRLFFSTLQASCAVQDSPRW